MLPHISPIHNHREDIGADYFPCGSQLVFHCSALFRHCNSIYLLLLSCGLLMLLTVKILKIRSLDKFELIRFDGLIQAWIIFHFCLQYLIQLMWIVIFETLRRTGDGFSPKQKLDEIAGWRNCCCSSEGTFCVLWNISTFHYLKCLLQIASKKYYHQVQQTISNSSYFMMLKSYLTWEQFRVS